MTSYDKLVKEINPLFYVAMAFLIVSWIMFSNIIAIPDNIKALYVITTFLVVYLAVMTRERKLITLKEAQEIALSDAKRKQNSGELKEEGKLVPFEDAKLWEVNKNPESIIVGIGISGIEPKVLIYYMNPYTAYIKETHKADYWDTQKDPNLKIIMSPNALDFLMQKRKFVTETEV